MLRAILEKIPGGGGGGGGGYTFLLVVGANIFFKLHGSLVFDKI